MTGAEQARALAHEWFIENPETRDLFNETETVHALADALAAAEAALRETQDENERLRKAVAGHIRDAERRMTALRERREALREAIETLVVQNEVIRGELSENLGCIITDGRIERYRAALARAGDAEGERITHGRHCTCTPCKREDWTQPHLACCGMHAAEGAA